MRTACEILGQFEPAGGQKDCHDGQTDDGGQHGNPAVDPVGEVIGDEFYGDMRAFRRGCGQRKQDRRYHQLADHDDAVGDADHQEFAGDDVKKNIKLLAEAKKKKISNLNACVLKRPRHELLVKELNKMNVKINYITDGDIAGALSVIGDKPKNDIYYSTGGGPEGVIVAAALSCYGGQIQGRLILDDDEKIRAKKLGIKNFTKKYNIDEMVKGDVIFCATGVTDGDLAAGVEDLGNEFKVTTFALHKSKKIIKNISNIYNK